jgi:alpha-beta hydrolase superfamily lysophospholipase
MRGVRFVRTIGKWLLVTITVLLLVDAYIVTHQPALDPEHLIEFEHEFDASMEDQTDWASYLQIEEQLADELEEKINGVERPDSLVDRFSPESLTYPGSYDANWNRSYELESAAAKGVAVLLHGLTDSPYSMLSTAQTLVGAGFDVVVPRMPGHGFAVGGLLQARWEDWTAAVRIAVRHAVELREGDQPLLLVGYSNGGLMAVDYALRCDEIEDLPCPDGLILLSPAIAITSLAAASNWHSAFSWIPFYERLKWLSILPEVDPFKFTSFPKRASWEIYKISQRTHRQLQTPSEAAKLPPILTFQSVVDNTVSASAIVTNLYDKLGAQGSELVVYDVNRSSTMLHLMKQRPKDPADFFVAAAPLNFGVTILRNRNRHGSEISMMRLAPGARNAFVESTRLTWPAGVFSLSHIAVPFRPDDPVYGDGSAIDTGQQRVMFGALAPRGEQGVLSLNPAYFLRARYNPFYEFQAAYLTDWLDRI